MRFRPAGIVKAQKKGPVHWFDREPGPANDTEVLTLALIVCDSGESAAGIDAWAKEVCLETARKQQLGDKWKPPATAPWASDLRKPGRNFLIVKNALEQPRTDDKLARIAKAVHVLDDLKGHTDVLDAGRLKDYFSQERREAKSPGSKKKDGDLRWKGSLIEIAQLVAKHRVRFQRALVDQRERSTFQTTVNLLADEREAVKNLSKELSKEKSARQTADKRHASLKAANNKYKQARAKKLSGLVAKARTGYKTKLAAAKKAATAAVAQRVKDALVRQGRTAEQIAADAIKVEQRKTAKARKRARKVEEAARVSKQRLADKQELEDEVKDLKEDLERHKEVLAGALAAKQRYTAIADKFHSIPAWGRVRGKGAGRGAKALEANYYIAIWAQLMNGTPLSAVPKNIVSVVRTTAPWLNPVEPTIEACRESRFALGTGEMAMAARRIAAAVRVRQLGFDETTKFQDPSMVTSVLVQPTEGAPPEVVICRAAYATGGGTAELLAKAIEEKCFARLRDYLRGWQLECEQRFPDHKWTGPDPERCGLQRLGGGGGFISDTCTSARCLQNLLIVECGRQVKEKYDPAEWLQLTEAEQEAAMRAHAHHCANHIRNIWLAALSKAQSAHVREKLKDQLDAFLSYERATTDFEDLIRQNYKEFHHGGRYYKGQGTVFAEDLRDNHAKAFVMHFERAEAGRQVS